MSIYFCFLKFKGTEICYKLLHICQNVLVQTFIEFYCISVFLIKLIFDYLVYTTVFKLIIKVSEIYLAFFGMFYMSSISRQTKYFVFRKFTELHLIFIKLF